LGKEITVALHVTGCLIMLPLRPLFDECRRVAGLTMALDSSEVEKIAHLARLGIDPADIPDYARNLSDILAFVEQLNAVDTTGVEPLAHPLDATQRLRADAVTETVDRENFQQHAPQTEAGLYLVPRVVE
jgi:aspartyl-tRNA(Asn)/glutamyl-tRNA(Gln) amidotransferase subunit C